MRPLRSLVGDVFRMVRILPPIIEEGEEEDVDIKELADADREGQERLGRAQKNLKPLRKGEITEEQFYKRALGIEGKEDGEG